MSRATFTARSLLGAGACALLSCADPGAGPVPPATGELRPALVDHALDRIYAANHGLLAIAGELGQPIGDGPSAEPAVLEARRFYQTLPAAPPTLESWLRTFGFPERSRQESLEAYRERAGIVVYYNKNELGLGRELGCAEFKDGPAGRGVACFVTNYGLTFRDPHTSLHLAQEGTRPRNTVCITYRPSMEAGYQVQFYVYGPDGGRQDWAQLDTFGPRPHPYVCMNCHGGVYDEQRHLAHYARFLPLEPNLVQFAPEDEAGGPTRSRQEERIRKVNLLALRSPLTPGQREMIMELYAGHPEAPGATSQLSWEPRAWRDTTEHQQLFDQVVKPYCLTCHLAAQLGADGGELFTYRLFLSPVELRRFPVPAVVCGEFGMPNAQPTSLAFWQTPPDGLTIGGKGYPAAADALLDFFATDRAGCVGLAAMTTCNRGLDPDAVCGNSFSGTACLRQSGRCFPQSDGGPPVASPAPLGVCRTNGSRACPYPLECRAGGAPVPGLEGFDGACVARE
jgi:hypothetical protein